jgi:hypothetical protein
LVPLGGHVGCVTVPLGPRRLRDRGAGGRVACLTVALGGRIACVTGGGCAVWRHKARAVAGAELRHTSIARVASRGPPGRLSRGL